MFLESSGMFGGFIMRFFIIYFFSSSWCENRQKHSKGDAFNVFSVVLELSRANKNHRGQQTDYVNHCFNNFIVCSLEIILVILVNSELYKLIYTNFVYKNES